MPSLPAAMAAAAAVVRPPVPECNQSIDLRMKGGIQWRSVVLGFGKPAWRWEFGSYEAVDKEDGRKIVCGSPPSSLAVFWTIGPGMLTREVVQQEWQTLISSGLLAAASRVVVNPHDWLLSVKTPIDRHGAFVNGSHSWRQLLPSGSLRNASVVAALSNSSNSTHTRSKLEEIMLGRGEARNEPAYEFPTLLSLWHHCRTNKDGLLFTCTLRVRHTDAVLHRIAATWRKPPRGGTTCSTTQSHDSAPVCVI